MSTHRKLGGGESQSIKARPAKSTPLAHHPFIDGAVIEVDRRRGHWVTSLRSSLAGGLEYRRPTGDFTNDQLLQGVRRAAGPVRDLAAKIEQSRACAFVIEGVDKRLVQFADHVLWSTLWSK